MLFGAAVNAIYSNLIIQIPCLLVKLLFPGTVTIKLNIISIINAREAAVKVHVHHLNDTLLSTLQTARSS